MLRSFRTSRTLLTWLVAAFLTASLVQTISAVPTHAISGADFKPGNIMGDATYYDKDSMNPGEIQAFLNAKVPSCQSGYTCLKSYRQNTPQRTDPSGICATYPAGDKVAAQIIYDVAQVCRISPRVLLTVLQKEQSLVTSTAPTDSRYRSATGYGCPDTAACDSKYYGFFNQVYMTAWQSHYYRQNANSYAYRAGRVNSILWSPATSCGRSDVFIENQTTAGLYIYTPYRPNQAALNNLYGTGDACSTYGNRNFWRIFSDWFGIDNKSLIRTPQSGTLYYIDGKYKYIVPSMEMVNEYGLGNGDVGFVSQSSIDSIPNSPFSTSLSFVMKSDSDSDDDGGDIYLITNGKRYRVTSMEQLAKFGFSASNISYLPYYSLVRMPHAGNLSDFVQRSDGALYRVNDAKKAAIFQLHYYNQLSGNTAPSRLGNPALARLTTTTPLIDDHISLRGSDGRIWLASANNWKYVPSREVLECTGIDLGSTPTFDSDIAIIGNVTGNAGCFTSDPSDSKNYMLNGSFKYEIKSEWGISGIVPAITSSLLGRQQTLSADPKSIFRDTRTGALYLLEQGKKRYVSEISVIYEVGQTPDAIKPLASGVASYFAAGHDRLGSGRVIQNTSTGQLYMMNNDKKMYITNMETFNHYGLKGNQINYMVPEVSSLYSADSQSLGTTFNIDGNTYFNDLGRRFIVPSNLLADYAMQSTQTYSNGAASVAPLVAAATKYLKTPSSGQLYYLENGVRRPVYSWERFTQLGGNNGNITVISDEMIQRYTVGPNM